MKWFTKRKEIALDNINNGSIIYSYIVFISFWIIIGLILGIAIAWLFKTFSWWHIFTLTECVFGLYIILYYELAEPTWERIFNGKP